MLIGRRAVLFVCAVTVLVGCQTILKRPDPDWTSDLDRADNILVKREGEAPIRITDPDVIKRIRHIYTESKWTPYWHTLPGDLGQSGMDICEGETRLRTFDYAGTLWESESYTNNRTAELSEADRAWLDSLFGLK